MGTHLLGLCIGLFFGAFLILAGLADPDKIVGTLRLKDFHVMRVIAVFLLVGILGTWILELAGVAHLSIKPAAMVGVLLGGALLGIGFGITGYCPGTGLACAAAGRLDALVSVAGMLAGALLFVLLYPAVGGPISKLANLGKVTIPEVTHIPKTAWVLVLVAVGTVTLILTRRRG